MNEDIQALLDAMAEALKQRLSAQGTPDPVMVGIHTGGVWVAEALHRRLALRQPLGMLDISFYRDDFSRIGMHPRSSPRTCPFPWTTGTSSWWTTCCSPGAPSAPP